MNENIESVLATLDGFRMSDEMTYSAYSTLHDKISLLDDLLKEQEPRVLTLEEARTCEVVWPEDKGEGELHPLIVQNNMNDSKYYKYGIHWRVWSAKPTNEQRKAVKWNGVQ